MKKKGKEIFKVVTATALSIGIFSAAFVGINDLALAAVTNVTESITLSAPPPIIPPSNTATNTGNEAPQTTDVTLSVHVGSVHIEGRDLIPSANALSPEAAAQIGAQYILDVIGECIDGSTVWLHYSSMPSMTRSFWRGSVIPSDSTDLNETTFGFVLDAVTGERIDIFNATNQLEGQMALTETIQNALMEARRNMDPDRFYELRAGGPPPQQLDAHIEAATKYAERHFVKTEIVSVEFLGAVATHFDIDANGNLVVLGRQITFAVTDNTGRVADVTIGEETLTLIRISTQHNDLVPSVNQRGAAERSADRPEERPTERPGARSAEIPQEREIPDYWHTERPAYR